MIVLEHVKVSKMWEAALTDASATERILPDDSDRFVSSNVTLEYCTLLYKRSKYSADEGTVSVGPTYKRSLGTRSGLVSIGLNPNSPRVCLRTKGMGVLLSLTHLADIVVSASGMTSTLLKRIILPNNQQTPLNSHHQQD